MDEKLRILLCEDDENLGMLLREYLQAKGYSAELYPDGEAGYKAFLKNKYDLCVFDVMMPKKDGFTLAQEVRAANAEIPIIFLTAKTLKEDILEGFKIGADDYIIKPFDSKELVARVKAVLRRYQTGSAPAAPAASTETGTETIQYTDLTFHSRNILDDLVSLCLTERKIVFVLPVFFDQIDKGIDGKRIMLRRDTKFLFSCSLVFIMVLQKIDLLQNLSRIA